MSTSKKLIEVSLPLEAINAASSREKSIRYSHPSTLHLWWSRKPLATARSVLWASLVDDPSSHPELFPTEEAQEQERQRLHQLLSDLVTWENSSNEELLEAARAEIRKYMGDAPLKLLDPFAGGGSIPLEAQRLGLEAHAHDINPVAVMINKAMIEIPPRFANMPPVNPESRTQDRTWKGANGLAEDVRCYGQWMKDEAFRRIGHLYPRVQLPAEQGGGEATVMAWIWARTVKCPNPACGCEMPLVSSFDLSKKKGKEAHVEPVIDGQSISYHVHDGKDETEGTVNRQGARCLCCGTSVGFPYIREEGRAGRMGSRLIAIAAEGDGRVYVSPNEEHVQAASVARPDKYPDGVLSGKAAVNVPNYGLINFSDLFTPRQLVALTTFSDLVIEAQKKATEDAVKAGLPDDGISLAEGGKGATAYGQAVGVYLAFVVDKLVDYHSTICIWHTSRDLVANTMRRQAVVMTWNYAEANPFCNSSGCFTNMMEWVARVLQGLSATLPGFALQHEAQSVGMDRDFIISTDPPYYDNIAYADLSDYFYIWMRQNIKAVYPELFRTMMVPKAGELVATPYRFEGGKEEAREFFEKGMGEALVQMYKAACADVPVTIYYAYKQSEADADGTASTGWETMLSAIIKAGFAITGTWPMRTELTTALKDDVNALASSIVLVCRKRPNDAPSCPRRHFLTELRTELHTSLKKLQASNIAPVDMAQAAIGPGMAVYSRYADVLEADGTPMSIRTALQIINQELDAYLAQQDGVMDAGSRFCLDLFAQSGFDTMKFGDADVLARARNSSVEAVKNLGLVYAERGEVRLLQRDELPEFAKRPARAAESLWMMTQYLIKAMETGGIKACAEIVLIYPSEAERARDLAYRLYSLADRKGWTAEAIACNSLATAWPDIQQQVSLLREQQANAQQGSLI